MLLENAFHYLPEILSGSNYAVQKYEAGIVNAVSLAALQELNARNYPNPLSALTVEKLYSLDGYPNLVKVGETRHLRADLYLDTSLTYTATEGLSRFGWRHRNYLEAKFFRPGSPGSTINGADLLTDILRLCILVPPQISGWEAYYAKYLKFDKPKGKQQQRWVPYEGDPAPGRLYHDLCIGRYLLHVYQGNPTGWLGKGKKRSWTKTLLNPGRHTIKVRVGDDDTKKKTFRNRVSKDLSDIRVRVTFTNRVIDQGRSTKGVQYHCVITRIDSFVITDGKGYWAEIFSRMGKESQDGYWQTLNALVGGYISQNSTGQDDGPAGSPPSPDELSYRWSGMTGGTPTMPMSPSGSLDMGYNPFNPLGHGTDIEE